MIELLRTNDMVLITTIEAMLAGAGVAAIVLDAHTSVIEGSIGAIPRRVMVIDEDAATARRVLRDAGISHGRP